MLMGAKINKIYTLVVLTAAIFTFILMGPLPGHAAAETGVVSGSVVNIRSGAGTQFDISGTLYKDTRVEILAKTGEWYKVQYGKINGWLHQSLLSNTTTATPPLATKKIQVIDGPINVRSGPATTYAIVTKIADKAIFSVLDEKDGWYRISLPDGKTGYVADFLVKEVNSSVVVANDKTTSPSVSSSPRVILNGTQMTFEVPPIIENGRTLVPLRAIFEAMGATVSWNGSQYQSICARVSFTGPGIYPQ